MIRKVSIEGMKEVREFFRELTANGQDYLLIEDEGKPVVGIVPSWQLEALETQQEELLDMLRGVWSKTRDVAPEEFEREVEEEVEALRRESSS